MKKFITVFLSFIVTIISAFIIVGCNKGDGNNQGVNDNQGGETDITTPLPDKLDDNLTPHTHSFGEWIVTKSATCEAEGSQSRYCSCGEVQTTAIGALGHNTQHHEGQEATCTVKGWKAYDTCSRCNYSTYEEIAPLEHKLTHHAGQEATYTADGWEPYETCSRCDYATYKVIPALKHNLVEYSGQAATCTADGWEEYVTCTDCDYTTYKVIRALGHNKVPHAGKTATCTEKGWNAYDTCSRCEYTTFEEVAALGHNIQHNEAKAATCTEKGWDAYDICSRCDFTTLELVEALGHNLLHHDGQEATCTEKGWNAYDTCSRCDYTTYQEVFATGHIFGDWNVIIAPTCTSSGAYIRICYCGETETKNVDALGHNNMTYAAHAATCTDIGWEQYEKCSRCSYTTYVELSALGHIPGKDVGYAATCTKSGLSDGIHCTVCGDILVEQTYTDALHIQYTYDEMQDAYIISGISDSCKDLESEHLILVNEYKGKPVVAIGDGAFMRYRSYRPSELVQGVYIRRVTIPEGIVSIGIKAFYNRSELQEVTIPSSVNYIGSNAFNSSQVSEGKDNFYQPIYKLRINITDLSAWLKIRIVADAVFAVPLDSYYAGWEKSLYLDGVFVNNLNVPDDVTEIYDYAFYGYTYLRSVVIGENVTLIGNRAFGECFRLKSVTIPDSVTFINDFAFSGANLENIYLSDISKLCEIFGRSIMDDRSSNKHIFLNGEEIINLTIPEGVTSICDYAFKNCTSFETVTIPNSVTSISMFAFHNCNSLTSVTISGNVTSIGLYAFDKCYNLESVYYNGEKDDWSRISIGDYNTRLTTAARYYYSETEPELNEEGTDYIGNYWHYDTDGITPVIWKKEN